MQNQNQNVIEITTAHGKKLVNLSNVLYLQPADRGTTIMFNIARGNGLESLVATEPYSHFLALLASTKE